MHPPLNPFADIVFVTLYARADNLDEKETYVMHEEGKGFCRRCYVFAWLFLVFFVVVGAIWRVAPNTVNLPLIIWIVVFVTPIILICFKPVVRSIKLYLKLRRRIRYIRNELHGHTSEISLPAPFGTPEETEGSGITSPTLEQCIIVLKDAFQAHLYAEARKANVAREQGVALLDTGVSELSLLLAHGHCFGLVSNDVTLDDLV